MSVFTKPSSVPKRVYFFLLPCLFAFYKPACGQVSISGRINTYAAVVDAGNCQNKLIVTSTSGFQIGNKVFVIQMQGAAINESESSAFGDITYNGAGLYEKATIASIDGNELTFSRDLLNLYNKEGSVQVVNIPQYNGDVLVVGTLTAAPWNGSTGGILAFEASGTVTLNADISVDGLGFQGGAIPVNKNNSQCFTTISNEYYYGVDSWEGAFKGEGIAAYASGKELGMGAQANGGGGGNNHNTGGGGGGNAGQGGKGGQNPEPFFSGNCRGNYPGLGGKVLQYNNERIFMGGGGGGGHSNNNNAGTPGANGGGIIYISANRFNGNGRVVSANGNAALDGKGDGVGGGGAGGTVLLKVNEFTPDDFTVLANGGNGASTDNLGDDRCFGPGGGGGGGLVVVAGEKFPDEVIKSASGGEPGITFNTSRNCDGKTNGASSGSPGTILDNVLIPESSLIPSQTCNPLPVDFMSFTASLQSGRVMLEWVTASETNNDYFGIERSQDGIHFNETGRMPGKGTVAVFSTYQFTDAHPFAGISYYRLRQVDIGGKFEYSKTVSIENNTNSFSITLYPNPSQEKRSAFLQILSPDAETLQIQVTSLLGEPLFTSTQTIQAGTTSIEIPSGQLSTGTYLVYVRSGKVFKIIKWQVL